MIISQFFLELGGKQCIVDIGTYNHGESFKLDCRTQCICIVRMTNKKYYLPWRCALIIRS